MIEYERKYFSLFIVCVNLQVFEVKVDWALIAAELVHEAEIVVVDEAMFLLDAIEASHFRLQFRVAIDVSHRDH